ncbi:hypothetical protein SAMN04489742_4894 [Arthrobacter crystallopoietes]|uniref:Uncharacterized protein n=1 Tax=Crystallibacter crystallopoietes TaxID=37928 RepID=A0A1H1I1U0_9MICC|nr:hypothetical protein SAMN04489742_4894 [Arthrobacter crystallopoietes]
MRNGDASTQVHPGTYRTWQQEQRLLMDREARSKTKRSPALRASRAGLLPSGEHGDIADRTRSGWARRTLPSSWPGDACSQQWTAWKTRPSRVSIPRTSVSAQRRCCCPKTSRSTKVPTRPSKWSPHRLRFHLDPHPTGVPHAGPGLPVASTKRARTLGAPLPDTVRRRLVAGFNNGARDDRSAWQPPRPAG